MNRRSRASIVDWVGSEILPHEADVRAWLRRTIGLADVEDVIQESYCRLSALDEIAHIRSARAYFFTTARSIVLERVRRARIVSIETVTEIDALDIVHDAPTPEQIAGGRRELARVMRLIETLPDRCRRVFQLRKVEGLSQREVAAALGVPEHTVENDVAKGLRLILGAIADGEKAADRALSGAEKHERARDG